MEFDRLQLPVHKIVEGFESGSLVVNKEYQRGEAWSVQQKQALIDSIFRAYPLPPIFLEEKRSDALFGGSAEKHEIIDGQQRIRALTAFFSDEFELLKPTDPKLRLPKSLRSREATWGGRRHAQLDMALKAHFRETLIDVFVVKNVQHKDEVRDLFIRLQSGTALTRQQIRDAWPGNMGQIIEEFAGKLNRRPKFTVFDAVDGRGTRDDDDDPRDRYVKNRQTCAQVMRILFARMSDPKSFPSVEAADIDGFYHESTEAEREGEGILSVIDIIESTQKVTTLLKENTRGRKKLPKLSLFALTFFFQDMQKNKNFKVQERGVAKLAEYCVSFTSPSRRSVSGPAINSYYEDWKADLPDGIGIETDRKRLFDDSDKHIIRSRDVNCRECGREVPDDQEEFDHYPIPHWAGGRTLPENGRLVHKTCHPRGRPSPA